MRTPVLRLACAAACVAFIWVVALGEETPAAPAGFFAASGGQSDQELPEGDVPNMHLENEEMTINQAMKMIAFQTKWQIFCSQEAARKQFAMFVAESRASDLLKNIVQSQGLVYKVQGRAIYIMTLKEYNEACGGAKEVIQLANVPADRVAAAVKPLLAAQGSEVTAVPEASAIMIYDSPANLRVIKDIVAKMDQPLDKETRGFPLRHAECRAVAGYLADMFGLRYSAMGDVVIRAPAPVPQPQEAPKAEGGQQPNRPPQPQPSYVLTSSRGGVIGPSSAVVGTVVADTRTNTVWVTDTPSRVKQIADVVEGLDKALETRVYQLDYADPKQIDLPTKLSGILMSPFDRYDIDDRTRIVSVTTTPDKMEQVFGLLEKWDMEPRQVLITGKVLSVSRERLRDIGVTYDLRFNEMTDHLSTKIQGTGTFPPVIPASPKGGLRIGDLVEDHFFVLLEALESDSTTLTLSSPRVLVYDGQQASFTVTTDEPYTEVVIAENQSTFQNVKFKTVGVTFKVIPQISSQNTVVMSVSLEVSSVQEFRGGVPVTSSSKADSKLLATNGMPLVIGGLITDQNMKSMDGVPGLSRLPLVGGLFRNTRADRSQRELVLVIVPSIVGGKPLAPEPTLTDVLRDVEAAPYLAGEAGEGETPAGAGVPFKGKKSEDAAEGK